MADRDDQSRPEGTPPSAAGTRDDPDAPPSAEEIAASRRLRDALDAPSGIEAHDHGHDGDDEVELARSLRAAWAPSRLGGGDMEEIVLASLSPEEARDAAALREALAGEGASPSGDLAQALASAWSPRPLSDDEHRAIVMRAIGAAAETHASRGAEVVVLRRRAAVVRVAFGTATAFALAAGVLFLVRASSAPSESPLARARSTQPLFLEPFKPGDASARIDRIAIARASDFRDNRFAKWGVK